MRKIISLALLTILFMSCNRNVDYAYSVVLNIKNNSSHTIKLSLTDADWPWGGKTYEIKANDEVVVKESVDGIPELNIYTAAVCFDSALDVVYINSGDASEYNICNNDNWVVEKDKYSTIWTYAFTDQDYDYAMRHSEP